MEQNQTYFLSKQAAIPTCLATPAAETPRIPLAYSRPLVKCGGVPFVLDANFSKAYEILHKTFRDCA